MMTLNEKPTYIPPTVQTLEVGNEKVGEGSIALVKALKEKKTKKTNKNEWIKWFENLFAADVSKEQREAELEKFKTKYVVKFIKVPLLKNNLGDKENVIPFASWHEQMFGPNHESMKIDEKAKALQEYHDKVREYFASIGDVVVPSVFITVSASFFPECSETEIQDGKIIVEIQPRQELRSSYVKLESQPRSQVILDFDIEKSIKIRENLIKIVRRFKEMIDDDYFKNHVLDLQGGANLSLDENGEWKIIDTNFNFDEEDEIQNMLLYMKSGERRHGVVQYRGGIIEQFNELFERLDMNEWFEIV